MGDNAYRQSLINDAKQAALNVATAAGEIFDLLDERPHALIQTLPMIERLGEERVTLHRKLQAIALDNLRRNFD